METQAALVSRPFTVSWAVGGWITAQEALDRCVALRMTQRLLRAVSSHHTGFCHSVALCPRGLEWPVGLWPGFRESRPTYFGPPSSGTRKSDCACDLPGSLPTQGSLLELRVDEALGSWLSG